MEAISRRCFLSLAGFSISSLFVSACSLADDKNDLPNQEMAGEKDGQLGDEIITPLYSIHLPIAWRGRARCQYVPFETCLTESRDYGPCFGYECSVYLDDSKTAEFFVMATKPAAGQQGPFYPQGTVHSIAVGQVMIDGQPWDVMICRAFGVNSSQDLLVDGANILETYSSYITVAFQPEDVVDDASFIGFLSSPIGDAWGSSAGKEYVANRMAKILTKGHWDAAEPAWRLTSVSRRDEHFSFDYASLSFTDSSMSYSIWPGISSLFSQNAWFSSFDYRIYSWEPWANSAPYEDVETDTKQFGVSLTLAFSADQGVTWEQTGYLLYEAVPYAGNESITPFLCLGKEGVSGYYTVDEPHIRDSVTNQTTYIAEAKKLYRNAFELGTGADEWSYNYGYPFLTGEEEVVWALPSQFENYKFEPVTGYYIKVFRPAGSSVDYAYDSFFTLYIYDYGDNSIKLKSLMFPSDIQLF